MWTPGDNTTFFRRLKNLANQHINSMEEGARLISLTASEDLATNLEDAADGSATRAEAIAFKGVVDHFALFMSGATVPADASRRAKIDAFLNNE